MKRIQILSLTVCLSLIGILVQNTSALPQHQHTDTKQESQDKNSKQKQNTPTKDSPNPDQIEQQSPNDHTMHTQQQPEQNTQQQNMQNMPDSHTHQDSSQTQMPTNHQHTMVMDMNSITGGPFHNHLAIGSGTSILPASSPGYMWYFTPRDWTIMIHGEFKLGFNYQRKPRGVGKAESQNNLMIMASHKLVGGELMFRTMLSAEPLTYPHGGSPQLFQVGETYHGRPIIDAQHPHDLVMELAASYTYPITENVSIQFYGGPVAEPALGPVAFMHRPSALENPSAPLGHHWQDSTHISHGVATVGLTAWHFKLEGSIFNAREPDEDRVAIDFDKMNSYSGRLWFTPTRNWTMQFSHGVLKRPEFHEPFDIRRTTASISYNRSWDDGNWASSVIWGRNSKPTGDSNVYLFESTVNFIKTNYFYTRIELADREGLLEENIFGKPSLEATELFPSLTPTPVTTGFEPQFRVNAFTFGGVKDVVSTSKLIVGIGADITIYDQPRALARVYGANPLGTHFFIRLRPGKMEH